jgi:prepilin-type processing-associated H-X9-DG protein
MSTMDGGRRYANQSVFLCPEAPTGYAGRYSPETDYFVNTAQARYQVGSKGVISIMPVNSPTFCPKVETPAMLEDIGRQSQIILASELWRTGGQPDAVLTPEEPEIFQYWWNYHGPNSTGLPTGSFSRHNGGANCLMVDGHSAWFADSALISDSDDMWGFSGF